MYLGRYAHVHTLSYCVPLFFGVSLPFGMRISSSACVSALGSPSSAFHALEDPSSAALVLGMLSLTGSLALVVASFASSSLNIGSFPLTVVVVSLMRLIVSL